MSIKLVEKAALPAWSPIASAKSLIALGGSAPGGGSDFSSGSDLEIYSLDASGRGSGMSVVARTHVESQFRSVGWANVGPANPLGIIAGGLNDGVVALWDVSRLIGPSQASSSPSKLSASLLLSQDVHNGRPVSCLEFNPQKPSLLVTGGCDGQVQVVNIERPGQPDFFRGVTTTKHSNSEVVCVSWNRKVQHILASASNQGLAVVWDLKNKKEVISIKDPGNRTKCSALSWNPEVPTQLLVAYNDDTNPCIQLWDMRNCSYPFREFQEHSRGVTCASFCDLDANLLVSSGRDNRSVCWSLNSGQLEAYSDLKINAPVVKVDWSPHLPGFIAAASVAGAVSVHSISQRQTPAAARYPPKWAKMPCGAAFGFGGKLVTFGSKQGNLVQIHVVPDEPAVVTEADKFEQYLASDLRPFCAAKVHESSDDHDRLTWTLISLLFEGPNARQQVVSAMGIDMAAIQIKAEKYLGKPPANTQSSGAAKVQSQDSSFDGMNTQFGDASNLNPDQLDNLFDQLAKNSEQQVSTGGRSQANSRRGSPRSGQDAEDFGPPTDWSQGPESIIKQSILVGDILSAVECCMKSGRYADALFLAATGGPELWKRTRDEYARKQKDPFIKLVGYVLGDELEKFVLHSDLNSWVETLAILITYARGEGYARLVEMLGERLEKERFDVRSAVLCYLACGSFENTVRIWASMSNTQGSQSQALQGLVEKMSCLFSAIRPSYADPIFAHKVLQYSALLANSGRILAAMRCLILVPDTTESRILKDRIYNAAPSMMGQLVRGPPQFPFDVADIRPAATATPSHPGISYAQHANAPHGFPGPSPQSRFPQVPPPTGPVPPSGPMSHHPPAKVTSATPPRVSGFGQQTPMSMPGPASGSFSGPSPPPQVLAPPPTGVTGFPQRPPPGIQGTPSPGQSHFMPQLPARPTTPGSSPSSYIQHVPKATTPHQNVQVPPSSSIPRIGGGVPPTSSIPARPQTPATGPHGIPLNPLATPPVTGFPPQLPVAVATSSHPLAPQPPIAGFAQSHLQNSVLGPALSQGIPQRPHTGHGPSPINQAPTVGPVALPPWVGQGAAGQPPQGLGLAGPSAHRPVVGPPTSGGVSTAPHATANPITPGMPVSWPVPTAVQQQLAPGGLVPPPKSAGIPTPVGEIVPPHEVTTIQRSFNSLLERYSQDGNRRKWDDTAKKLTELYDKLGSGQLSRESVGKIKELCTAIDRNDFPNASRIRVELSATEWERNRTWLFAVQLLLPK